ncbi:AI-2E family transporter [Candidatus Gracilibacteria bacterium]|nr:AI-2E family transporter [Candidatus Gracilibacteria bacterium]
MFHFKGGPSDILKALAIVLAFSFAFIISDILALVFIAIILTSAFNPTVEYLESRRVPRTFSVLTILGVSISLMYLLINTLIPPLVSQTQTLINSIPQLLSNITLQFNLSQNTQNQLLAYSNIGLEEGIIGALNDNSDSLLRIGTGIFGSLIKIITVIVLTYYLLVEHGSIQEFFGNFFEGKSRDKFIYIWGRVEHKLGVWLRGQFTVMFIIGLTSYIGLSILGLPFALPLAIIAGLLEIIPIIGPAISVIPAVLIAASTLSPITILSVLILYFIIQQVENIYVVPKVMNQAVGLNPILIILAVMVGSRLGGPMGALLSVPISAVILIAFEEWKKYNTQKNKNSIVSSNN